MKKTLLGLMLSVLIFSLGAQELPPVLRGEVWKQHFLEEILPYWDMETAYGVPVGNFPTHRARDGKLIWQGDRWPRMLGRQVYLYSVAFMLTGEGRFLDLAKAGVNWLIEKAWDHEYGGWYARLKEDGEPYLHYPKYAQDMAYAAQGLAAYFVITRDALAEEYLIKTFEIISDPEIMWDGDNNRVWDGADRTLEREMDQEGGGWELVAILDQINAYMLGVQPFLTDPEMRETWKESLLLQGQSLIDHFLQDGIFWGQADRVGMGGRHVDFGHTLKSFWMLERLDQRFDVPGFRALVDEYSDHWLRLAYDDQFGYWGSTMTSFDTARYGSSWWIYVECSQYAATLNLTTGSYTDMLATASQGWLDHFVDQEYGDVYQGIRQDGSRDIPPVYSNTKSWEWKNGFHSAEHALILYLHGQSLEGLPSTLHFATTGDASDLEVSPYYYQGEELGRTVLGSHRVEDLDYEIFAVDFGPLQ